MTNYNYLVETNKKKYILKFFGRGTEKLISRELEKKNLEIVKLFNLDVNNYIFDIKQGIEINEYIENAITYDEKIIKTKLSSISKILQIVHLSKPQFNSKFDIFFEIEKYESLIENSIPYKNYKEIKLEIIKLKEELNKIGLDYKNCHIDLVPENFIEDTKGRIYLIDWEYCAVNDPMWDIASLFLESNFIKSEEEEFFNFYKTEKTPINQQKIFIYKILQDILWSLWTVYKEEQGTFFGTYGRDRYERMLKNLEEYKARYEK
ncbi:phosphotransferase [Gemella sp. zg-570]|nr:phosphotransferase [Gemella sp. zg-1178]QWQ39504.1 phosphotransferase [Gemella sp. zg-570]